VDMILVSQRFGRRYLKEDGNAIQRPSHLLTKYPWERLVMASAQDTLNLFE
jgi:hypothetical protein